ncbi:helix-turn-helix domain-containing protein [Zhongshania aliphaticivorans]|uniref:helix-turn-helix domain-containing protein n=1 Tax=Zhongshania aliphaticivorans TaxID=1470434 RepID=UPI0012E58397|nr:helix-turn-helix domain-containing protein [Zhongshania aliphaticivorans]CAA0103205.1 Uncharacterised protein [Zhongshania aliphaticivorans]
MKTIDDATKQLIQDPIKRRAWVIFQLSLKGQTFASVAREHGYERTAPRQAFERRYPRMEQILADAVGLPVQALWPERYDLDGTPLIVRGVGRPPGSPNKCVNKDTRKRKRRNVSNHTNDRQVSA